MEHGTGDVSVICKGCGDAIHVALRAFVEGAQVTCHCGTSRNLADVDPGLPRDQLLDQAAGCPSPVRSEFPTS